MQSGSDSPVRRKRRWSGWPNPPARTPVPATPCQRSDPHPAPGRAGVPGSDPDLAETHTREFVLHFGPPVRPAGNPARPMPGPPQSRHRDDPSGPRSSGEVRPAPGPSRPDAGNEPKTKTENAHSITL